MEGAMAGAVILLGMILVVTGLSIRRKEQDQAF
jgi:hypothetical protein